MLIWIWFHYVTSLVWIENIYFSKEYKKSENVWKGSQTLKGQNPFQQLSKTDKTCYNYVLYSNQTKKMLPTAVTLQYGQKKKDTKSMWN